MIRRIINNNKIIYTMIILFGILSVLTFYEGYQTGTTKPIDFQWDAIKAITMKINPYKESINPSGIMDRYSYEQYYGGIDAEQFPSLLFMLLPFTFFNPQTANLLWFGCNVVFSFLFLFFLRRTFFIELKREHYILLCSMFLSCAPIRFCLKLGQAAIFSAAFWVMAVYFAEKRRRIVSGLMLSISYFKFTFTLPLALYFLYKKWYKEFIISVIPHIVLTIIAAWWLDESIIHMITQPIQVSTWLTSEGLIDIGTIIGRYLGNLTIVLECVLGIVLIVIVFILPTGYDQDVVCGLVYVSLVITYHRSYDFFLLIIPLGLTLFAEKTNKVIQCMAIIVCMMIFYVETVLSRIEGFTGKLHNIYNVVLVVLYYGIIIGTFIYLLKAKRKEA